MAVAAVLAQQRGGVPQHGERFGRPVEGGVGGEQGAAVGRRRLRRRARRARRPPRRRRRRRRPERPAQGGDGPGPAGLEGCRRAGRSPTRRATPWRRGTGRSCRTARRRRRVRPAPAVRPGRRSSPSRSRGSRASARAAKRLGGEVRHGVERLEPPPDVAGDGGVAIHRPSVSRRCRPAAAQVAGRSASSGSRPWTYHAASTPPTAPKTWPVHEMPGRGRRPQRIPP